MAASSNFSSDDLDFFVDSSSINTSVDADLPPFDVIPRRLWVGKIVDMKNVSGVTVASGILQVLHSTDIPLIGSPLEESYLAVQVSKTFFEEE